MATPYQMDRATPMLAKKGDDLTSAVTQAGYTINYDGYGLATMSVKYILDWQEDFDFEQDWKRGDKCLVLGYEHLTLIRVSMTANEGRTITVNAEYVGVGKGTSQTQWQCTVSSAASSEPIESHPNFTRLVVNNIGGILAGPAKSDPTLTLNNAFFVNSKQGQGALPAWQFVGFLPENDAAKTINIKAGVKTYMRPNLTLKCMGYTTDSNLAGKVSIATWNVFSGDLDELKVPEPYSQIAKEIDARYKVIDPNVPRPAARNWLCIASNVEMYGAIYKIQAEFMLSGWAGWDKDIYPKARNK
jgi:hypothetical protein